MFEVEQCVDSVCAEVSLCEVESDVTGEFYCDFGDVECAAVGADVGYEISFVLSVSCVAVIDYCLWC